MGRKEWPIVDKCCKHGGRCDKRNAPTEDTESANEYVNMGPDQNERDQNKNQEEKIKEFANSLGKDIMLAPSTYDNIPVEPSNEAVEPSAQETINSSTGGEQTDFDTDTSFKVLPSKTPKKTKKNRTKKSECSMSEKKNRKSNDGSSCSRKSKTSLVPKKREAKVEKAISRNHYLGVMTRKQAEKNIGSKKRFAVYHQVFQLGSAPVLVNMQREVFLSAIYRSEKGTFTHFYIREHIHDDLNREFYVDTGRSNEQKLFQNIEHLMEYYCKV